MKKAFTLIELLVVIAIIAILAAILFPVFAQAKIAAKKTQDLSNMKQIGTGIMLYINDADDVYPMGQYNSNPDPTQWESFNWQTGVDPYVKSGKKFTNGAGRTFNNGAEGLFAAPDYPKRDQSPGAYAIRMDVAPDGIAPWTDPAYRPKTVSSTVINRPADKVYIIHRGTSAGGANSWNWAQWLPDEWNWVDWLGAIGDEGQMQSWANQNPNWKALKQGDCDDMRGANGPGPTWENCGHYPRYRYNGSSNMVFFDGHAKSYRRGANGMQISYPVNIFIPGITNGGGDIY